MATIREVAEKAGVSFTTVSHVINHTRFVSEETRQRVLDAMKQLNYRPNALARSLRRGQTHTLGLILPDSSNPFFAEIAHNVESAAFKLGYSVILCNTERDPQREQLYVEVLSEKQVDGVMFIAAADQIASLQLLISLDLPVVVVDRQLPDLELDSVLTDNRQGGRLATQHLIELGHRRIACISGPSNLTPSGERLTGFREAMAEAGLEVDEALILRGDYHPESGRLCTSQLLRSPEPPTAIFACNDLMAYGALRAVAEAGCQAPRDVSIVGFDNIELSGYTSPPLTTIAQPKEEIGRLATLLLAERMANKALAPRKILLPTEIMIRGSSGRAPYTK